MQYQQNCTYQVTLQPSSKMMFEGDWGCCPNKQFLKIEPKAKLKKMGEPVQVYTACQRVYTLIGMLHKSYIRFCV